MKTLLSTVFCLVAFPVFGQQPSSGQQPAIENARLQTKAFSGSLNSMLQQFGKGPLWAAWSEPARPGHNGSMCDWHNSQQSQLHLEGIRDIVLLVRVEDGRVDKLRTTSSDCRLDAGGLPFFWIENVPAAQSVAWLKSRVTDAQPNESRAEPAILGIALHQSTVSDAVLDELTQPNQPEKVRSKTAFWLGNVGGKHGVEMLRRLISQDPSEHVRREVTFALSQSKEPEALALLIDTAKHDRAPQVRSQAVFWLAQKAGNKQAAQVVGEAVEDPDRQVKEKAIFALSQLPDHEGIPKLIELAKSNRDPELRKKAVFWLGQSKDPRATEFFEQVLK